MQTIPNRATSNDFTSALTVDEDDAESLAYTVANASVIAQFKPGRRESGGRGSFSTDVLITPSTSVVPNCSGARFRSAVAGLPAQVVAILTAPDDPQIGAGIPFPGILSASGAVSTSAMILGRVLGNGSIVFGGGYTIVRLSAGRYRVVFDNAFPVIPVCLANIAEATTGNETITLSALGASQFQVNVNDPGAGAVDREFNFAAIPVT